MSSCRSDLLPGSLKSAAAKNKHFAQVEALAGIVVWLNSQSLGSFLRYVNRIRNIWQGKSVPEHKGIPPEKQEQLRWMFWHCIGCLNSTLFSILFCFLWFHPVVLIKHCLFLEKGLCLVFQIHWLATRLFGCLSCTHHPAIWAPSCTDGISTRNTCHSKRIRKN